MDERLSRIADKLRCVRRRWFRRRSFGEETHHFNLQPPLPESVLTRFESEHGVSLPEEYRLFLLGLGNGGAGPSHGLLSLETAATFPQADDIVPAGYLGRPCLLRPDKPPNRNWLEEIGCSNDVHYSERFQGTLAVCHHGCTYYGVLVVSGPARGRVVNINLDDSPPVFAGAADFLAWYEQWLDEVLKPRKLGEVAWFGCNDR